MEDYRSEDVISALVQIPLKSRKRSLVDQRSYLIAVLAYKFFMSENQIARVSHYKRDRVHYNKKLALQFYNDRSYKENVYVQAVMFPFNLNEVETIRPHRSKRIELDIDSKFYRKLRAAGAILGHKDIRTTIKLFLEKSLKLWEE